jgi:peptide/nickel transport system permease protein
VSVALQQEPGVADDEPRRRGRFLWRVLRERPSAAVGAAVFLLFVAVAVLAPVLAPYGLHDQVGPTFGRPSGAHPLGLDDGGIDMVTLLMWGARISLVVGLAATVVAVLIGGTVGVLAGYFGGATDTVLMRVTDYFLVVPDVPLMIVVAAIWGPSLTHIIVVIAILLWAGTARIIRAQVKSVRERVYVKRARSLGAGHARVVFRHVLPQIAPLLIANTVLTVAVAIFDETALSFLGLGDPSKISLGKVIENGFKNSAISFGAWWAIVPPGVLVSVLILSLSLMGQAMEDSLNPRLRVANLSVRRFRLVPPGAVARAARGKDDRT